MNLYGNGAQVPEVTASHTKMPLSSPKGRWVRERAQDYITLARRRPMYFYSLVGFIVFLVVLRELSSPDILVEGGLWHSSAYRSWNYERDSKILVLGENKCHKVFPGLFEEVDRMVERRRMQKITLENLDEVPKRNGYIRAFLYDQQLYVNATEGGIYSRGFAVLQAIHRAVVSSPEPLPNIEFIVSTDDKLPPSPIWSFAREQQDTITWLMPDFGFWSWPETKVGSYGEVQRKAKAMEDTSDNPTGKAWTWDTKHNQILWRGAAMGLQLREHFISVTSDKTWADVKEIDWKNATASGLKSMDEHCQYKYLAHTEGNSYSGRLKYLQNCRSVIVAHKMDWIQHYNPLMIAKGRRQNYVEVERDYSDLEPVMKNLLSHDNKARRIANNNVRTFRERYLTPAANACYWRHLIRGWAEVSFKPSPWVQEVTPLTGAPAESRHWRGLDVESYLLERRLEWIPY